MCLFPIHLYQQSVLGFGLRAKTLDRSRVAPAGARRDALLRLYLRRGYGNAAPLPLEPQPGLPAALEQAATPLDGFEIEIGGLAGYAERAHAEAPKGLEPLCAWLAELGGDPDHSPR